jgi:hypothetical protein
MFANSLPSGWIRGWYRFSKRNFHRALALNPVFAQVPVIVCPLGVIRAGYRFAG